MVKKILILSTLIFLLTSCSSYISMVNADTNMRKVAIGMTQKEVTSIMGNEYEVIAAYRNELTWAYKTFDNSTYLLYFRNGKLEEWEKEPPVIIIPSPPPPPVKPQPQPLPKRCPH